MNAAPASDPLLQQLRASAAIRPLATALYVAHCRADGVKPVPFASLALHVRRHYEDIATHWLKGLLQPRRGYFAIASQQATAYRDKVVGRISPEEPYGIDPRD